MPFLTNYLHYNKANEVPDIFTFWGGIFLLSSVAQRRVYISLSESLDSYQRIHPMLYFGFIGSPASGKSYAKDRAREIFEEAVPLYPQGASSQSKEVIVKELSEPESIITFENEKGEQITTHSLTFFINELKNWLSINPLGMIDFLTDVYDTHSYQAKTIKHGSQTIERPCINILACEVPEWIQKQFKMDILSGGFARRFIPVYYPHGRIHKADQSLLAEHLEARRLCVEHLQKISTIVGRFTWSKEAWRYYAHWYETTNFESPNKLMSQFNSSLNTTAVKVAMALALNEDEPQLILTLQNIQDAIGALKNLEPSMLALFSSIGRNEFMPVISRLLLTLKQNHGRMLDSDLLKELTNDVTVTEFGTILYQLERSNQIVKKFCELKQKNPETGETTSTAGNWIMTIEYAIKHGVK